MKLFQKINENIRFFNYKYVKFYKKIHILCTKIIKKFIIIINKKAAGYYSLFCSLYECEYVFCKIGFLKAGYIIGAIICGLAAGPLWIAHARYIEGLCKDDIK